MRTLMRTTSHFVAKNYENFMRTYEKYERIVQLQKDNPKIKLEPLERELNKAKKCIKYSEISK
ncbi:MAG: hypothetical protein JXR69_08040 [Candidatus Delongbacteria bacterium]|nr:hypothetical protein [Candidatus Delongbacteria bacterium]